MFSLKNVVISGGNFTAINNTHPSRRDLEIQRGLEILRENIVPDAFHDSAERYEPPKCLPRTREAVLKKILEWVKDSSNSKKLFLWLYGPAGVGKSAIAQTIAEICQREGLLAGSFFFSRTAAGRSDETRLIATLAYQISLSIPTTRDAIYSSLGRDSTLVSRSLLAQVQALIVGPLSTRRTHKDRKNHSMLIILDGLDECGNSQGQKHILEALGSLVKSKIPLIFLIASRPEYGIRDSFNVDPLSSQFLGIALDGTYRAEEDLETFFHSKFDDIRTTHPLKGHLPLLWPPAHSVKLLVEKSSGQFIYASTVMTYITSPCHRPEDRLDVVLGVSPSESDSPFAQLDALYSHILESSANTETVFDALSLLTLDVHVRHYPKYINTIRFMEALFDYRPGELQLRLRDFSALVHVPAPQNNPNYLDEDVYIYHASFVDFLLDRSRSGGFFLDPSIHHERLARFWIRLCTKTSPIEISDDAPGTTTQGMIIISHCVRSTPSADLLADLRNYDFITYLYPSNTSYLDGPGHPIVRFTRWLAKHDKLPRLLSPDAPDYLLSNIDNWIYRLINWYPRSFKNVLPALLSFPHFLVQNHRQIFSILASRDTAYDIVRMEKVDGDSFRLKRTGLDTFDLDLLMMISDSLSDSNRAGKLLATPMKFAGLAYSIAVYLYERPNDNNSSDSEGEGEKERYPFRRLPGPESDSESDDGDTEEPELSVALSFLPMVLDRSSHDDKLATLLRDHCLQFSSTDTHSLERRKLAITSLAYIRKCSIPFVNHRHELEWIHDVCVICELSLAEGENEPRLDSTPPEGYTRHTSKPIATLSRLFKKLS